MSDKLNFIFENLDNRTNFVDCKDVNRSGILRFGMSPLLNATHMYFASNHKPLTYNYCDVSEDAPNYIISAAVNHSPDDWTGYDPKVKSLFSHLNAKYLNDLRNKKALLLLDQSFEGYHAHWLWDWFHKDLNEYKISPKCIVYVTGNMIADENYEEWANKNNITERMKIIPYPHFELDMGTSAYYRNNSSETLPTFGQHIKYKTENLDKIKSFACLNKRLRFHRVWFYRYIFEAGLLDKGLVSMNEFEPGPYFFEGQIIPDELRLPVTQNLPRILYGKRNNELDDNYYINRFNDDVCLDTYMTVISEAHCGDSDETMFLSEKTFKVIACRHPFMIMGNKDSMRMMRKIGYKTFDGFIDESYDSLPTHERMKSIIESIKKVDSIPDKLEWFKSMYGIVEYNYETLIKKLFRVPDAFSELEKYYKTFTSKLI